jgi:hypothetical protein
MRKVNQSKLLSSTLTKIDSTLDNQNASDSPDFKKSS